MSAKRGLKTVPTGRSKYAPSAGARDRLTKARDRMKTTKHRGLGPSGSLLDAKAAAKLMAVPYTWLLAQARDGKIPHHKLGHYVRFDPDDLIAWLDATKIQPGGPARRRGGV